MAVAVDQLSPLVGVKPGPARLWLCREPPCTAAQPPSFSPPCGRAVAHSRFPATWCSIASAARARGRRKQ